MIVPTTTPAERAESDRPLTRVDLPTARGIRRRRAAARRLEPLHDGRRDPLSFEQQPPAPCTRSLHVEVGKRSAWLRGEDIRALLAVAQIDPDKRQYDSKQGAWAVPIDFADQVVTVAEWRQRRHVTFEAVAR